MFRPMRSDFTAPLAVVSRRRRFSQQPRRSGRTVRFDVGVDEPAHHIRGISSSLCEHALKLFPSLRITRVRDAQ